MKMKTHHTQTYETKMKVVLRKKFIARSAFIRKLERSHTNNLTAHLKALEQQQQQQQQQQQRIKHTQEKCQETNSGIKSIN